MSETRFPNFFVVGAPKSGTTSLYIYLKQHPQVFLPRKKELNYFCTDLHFNYPILDESQFQKYYDEVRNEIAIGEVSVWNLLSSDAAENIFDFNPASKIIIILRNPVDMIYAMHSNHIYSGNETIIDFEDALKAEEARKRGEQIPESIRCPLEGLYYRSIGAYSSQVKRYFEVFKRENIKVILFDDFVSETEKTFKEVLSFLNLNTNYIPELKAYNVSKKVMSNFFRKLTTNPPDVLKQIGRVLFPHQSAQRDWLMKKLWKLNSKKAEREKMSVDLRENLIKEFTTDIKQLEQLIERDLSQWLL